MYRHTYGEVNLDVIENNVKSLITNYNDYKYYIGVVKGNAYGHGFYIVNTLIEAGINYLAVSSLEEAIKIRKYNKQIPILCLQPISIDYLQECVKNDVTLTIPSIEYFNELEKYPLTNLIKLHIKIDSGMNRLGIKDKYELKEIFDRVKKSTFLEIEGLFSHFQTPGISDYIWDRQVNNFKEITSLINLKKVKMVHMGRSLTLVNHPKLSFCNGVRVGLIMYGFDNTPHYSNGIMGKLRKIKADMRIKKYSISATTLNCKAEVNQAISLISEIIHIKKVSKDDYIGYGTTYKASKDMLVGVVSIGYADGYDRRNKNGYVVVNGKKFKVLGDICMEMTLIEVDDTVKLYDSVELYGKNRTVRNVSISNNTTSYETLARIPSDLPRVYIKNKKIINIEE